MKIAVYTANFGNYRNEVSKDKMNKIKFSNDIDYFFFTDIDIICKWNVQKVKLEKSLPFMNEYRHTSKKYKFCLSNILNTYDYVIWCDTKCLKNIDNLNLNKIKKLITNLKKPIYLIKHYKRINPVQELTVTSNNGMENKINVDKFKNKFKNIKLNSLLPDTKTFIRKVDNLYNNFFEEIYNNMLIHKLCRDQNVINYIFYIKNLESQLFYFNNDKDFINALQ